MALDVSQGAHVTSQAGEVRSMKIILVVAARPNFMKVAPLLRAMILHEGCFSPLLVHTGQHYDASMSGAFFQDLGLPEPDIHLGIGSGSHAEQTGRTMIAFEQVLQAQGAHLVLVVGDVNATLACALTAVKLHVPIAHVEAGLRSFDRRMPEEINRIVTDAVSRFLFTPSPEADAQLLSEGIPPERIFQVGNIMVDSLLYQLEHAAHSQILATLGLEDGKPAKPLPYAVLTLHRPSNVDDPQTLRTLFAGLRQVARSLPIIFPVHPRTRVRLKELGLEADSQCLWGDRRVGPHGLYLLDPLGYSDFLALMAHATIVLTDSGGIQEETTVLKIPCLTLRETTERPITVERGTNVIVGTDPERLVAEADRILAGKKKVGQPITLWDGKTAPRIVDVLLEHRRPLEQGCEDL
jgi:UDP-N-acetylglucosamine 2-epimerase (non-hydrolysing)